jgi:hypothetical protein
MGDVEIGEQVVEIEESDMKEVQMYVDFVKKFKSQHLELGYGLDDIVQQVNIRYGKKIELQQMKDFENMLLQKESYAPLLEILDTWIKDTVKASGSIEMFPRPLNNIFPHRTWKQRRKQKTAVDSNVTMHLEEEFARKKSPTPSELTRLASSLGVERDYVRNWFYNRRRKEKCMGKRPAGREEEATLKMKPLDVKIDDVGTTIPSVTYDITVEVPSIHIPLCAEYTLQN